MENEQKNALFTEMVKILELPDSAYEAAKSRYEDIGEWFVREDSKCRSNDPHVFAQGSFRLGTAIMPLNEKDAYDLDLACKLVVGIAKSSHSQRDLKELIGHEIELYRQARGIKAPMVVKHRCWRLDYQDNLSFHMDIVPCIPEVESRRQRIYESLRHANLDEATAGDLSRLTVSITDDRHSEYGIISDDWPISNPEGFAIWFQMRMKIQKMLLVEAQIDDLPLYKRKTPLQHSIQLLKRHRDLMFRGREEIKPISIIITTLAARAYQGENELAIALPGILSRMETYVNEGNPRVHNPVDPAEDFADKWDTVKGKQLRLEENFWNWLQQAKVDFELICSKPAPEFIASQALEKLQLRLGEHDVKKWLGLTGNIVTVAPKATHIVQKDHPRPWARQ